MNAEAQTPDVVKPPITTVGPLGWAKNNLFSSWHNALLTMIAVAAIVYFVPNIIRWFITAEWKVLTVNLQILLVGSYPDEEIWRVGVSMLYIPIVLGLAWGVWPKYVRVFGLSLAILCVGVAALPITFRSLGIGFRIYLLLHPVLMATGYALARFTPVGKSRWVLLIWFFFFVITVIVLQGFKGSDLMPNVGRRKWGGLLVTLLLAQAGSVVAFPLGVLLALGRRSSLPFVKSVCIAYIEVLRGTPLLALLFVTQVLLPVLLPDSLIPDRLTRGLIALIMNNAAYMAENVRGGLQSVPSGQTEAAKAVALKQVRITLFIVLPQALRNVLPAIAGQFIILFKDTAVISLLGLHDFLGTANVIVSGNQRWANLEAEVYIFVALVYWIFTFTMSKVSGKMEKAMGVGERF